VEKGTPCDSVIPENGCENVDIQPVDYNGDVNEYHLNKGCYEGNNLQD